jgi:hypothetical protein
MRRDPIVEEIHRIRKVHAKRFNYDVSAIFADIRKRRAKRTNLVDLSGSVQPVGRVAESPAVYRTKRSRA